MEQSLRVIQDTVANIGVHQVQLQHQVGDQLELEDDSGLEVVEEVVGLQPYKRRKTEKSFDDEILNEIESDKNDDEMDLNKFISIDWSSGGSTTTNSEFEYLGINRHLNKI